MLRRQLAEVETGSISSRHSVSPTRSTRSPNRSTSLGSSRAAVGRWIDSASSSPLPASPVSASAPSYYVSPLTGTAVRTTPSPSSPCRPALAAAALRLSRSTSAPERARSSPILSGGDDGIYRRRPQTFLSVDLQRPSAASSAEIRAQLQSSLRTTTLSTLSARSLAEAVR